MNQNLKFEMSSRKLFPKKVDFRIRLLSGDNVVLVEACGFETELFMPEIVNGRINFRNIVPNRRCCESSRTTVSDYHHQNRLESASQHQRRKMLSASFMVPSKHGVQRGNVTNKLNRVVGGQDYSRRSIAMPQSMPYGIPITPAPSAVFASPRQRSPRSYNRQRNIRPGDVESVETPEECRADNGGSSQIVRNTIVQIPNGIKVIRVQRSVHKGMTLNPPRGLLPNEHGHNENTKSNTSGFSLPKTPPVPPNRRLILGNSPLSGQLSSPNNQNILRSVSGGKWRKCITPKRTYARKGPAQIVTYKKSALPVRVVPTYMLNPTSGPKVEYEVDVKKRKLVVDPKSCISPQTIRDQQSQAPTPLRRPKLPTTAKELEGARASAFQLLTQSNRGSHVAKKLAEQFRKSCINKASSTIPKYKELCRLPMDQNVQMKELQKEANAKTARRRLDLTIDVNERSGVNPPHKQGVILSSTPFATGRTT